MMLEYSTDLLLYINLTHFYNILCDCMYRYCFISYRPISIQGHFMYCVWKVVLLLIFPALQLLPPNS